MILLPDAKCLGMRCIEVNQSPTRTQIIQRTREVRDLHLKSVKMLNKLKARAKAMLRKTEGTLDHEIMQVAYSTIGHLSAAIQIRALGVAATTFAVLAGVPTVDADVDRLKELRQSLTKDYAELLEKVDGLMHVAYEARAQGWIKDAEG